ncbi:MAG TPA: protein kinase [Polyangium sp.]|nr:protein kinase [Polyangium sp.]
MDAPVAIGNILLDKYRVERVLGQGGMGVVVAVRHVDLKQLYAMKFLLPKMVKHPEALERFLREAQAAAQIRSEHVARVHDVGRMSDGAPYMIMEYLEGNDLKTYLAEHGPLSVEEAVGFVLDACDAIAEAHALGIIHRDLKPANMFVVRRRNGSLCLKVLDFGISKHTAPDKVELTDTNVALGSPLYMSPEQIAKSKMVDNRSDLWALGLIGYELLTGTSPFRAETMLEVVAKVRQEEPCPLRAVRPDVPVPMAEAIMRCLRKRRDERWASVEQFAQVLEQCASRVSIPRLSLTDEASLPPDGVTKPEPLLGTTVPIPGPHMPLPAPSAERTSITFGQTGKASVARCTRESSVIRFVAATAIVIESSFIAPRFLGGESSQQRLSETVNASPQVSATAMPTASSLVNNALDKPKIPASSHVRKDEPVVVTDSSVGKTVIDAPHKALTNKKVKPSAPLPGAAPTSIVGVPAKPEESAPTAAPVPSATTKGSRPNWRVD